MSRLRLILGIGGASGTPYAARMLQVLRDHPELAEAVDVSVIFSNIGRTCWAGEVGGDPKAEHPQVSFYDSKAMTAPMASGSARYDAMVILPCSASGLGRIANGVSNDLLGRAAEVMLKERRPLVLGLREAPYHLPLIRNMAAITEAGAVVLPLSPPFYGRPQSIDDLLDSIVARVLDLVGVQHELIERWSGRYPAEQEPKDSVN